MPPHYPVPDLQRELEEVGFSRFFETTDSVKHRVSGAKGDLDVMIIALRAPADGPIGDSGLVVDDGETVCFNMNDARPIDLDVLHADFGHVDVHMLQYSGAIWYPMVYDMPARAKEAFGTGGRRTPARAAAGGARADHVAERSDLRRHRVSGRAAAWRRNRGSRLPETRGAGAHSGREVPIRVCDRAGVGPHGAAGRRAGLGEHRLP